ncbi:MAG TPA: NrsF family protein [Polyangia bacterium]|jgi:hypothetical protein|nr:NrsF family protein [Polyangia bacterium]
MNAELRARVLSAAAQIPAPTRTQVALTRLWLLGGAIAGALAIFFVQGGVRPTGRPLVLVALTTLGTSVVVAAGMYFLFTRSPRSMSRRPFALAVAVTLLSALAFVAWRHEVSAVYGLVVPWPDRVGFRCLRVGILTGALPLFAALVIWRRTDPVTPAATGAAFGAGAGLGSAVLTDLWCPVSYLPHLMLGHVLPIVVLSCVGALFGYVALRVRRR